MNKDRLKSKVERLEDELNESDDTRQLRRSIIYESNELINFTTSKEEDKIDNPKPDDYTPTGMIVFEKGDKI